MVMKFSKHGKYLREPLTTHFIIPPLLIKTEVKEEILFRISPTVTILPLTCFYIATAVGSPAP